MTTRQAPLPQLLPAGDIAFIRALIETANERFIVPRFQNLSAEDAATAHSIDAVTVADTEAEAFLTEALLQRFPDAGIVGEEATKGGVESRIKPLTFTIDPVDGTRQFALGKRLFGTIVSASLDETISHAWITCPLLDLRAYAANGHGAVVNGRPAAFNDGSTSTNVPLVYYPKYNVVETMQNGFEDRGWESVSRARSIAAETCLALAGGPYVHVSNHYSAWDHAGPLLLFAEAGGYTWREHGDARTLRPGGTERLVYATSAAAGAAAQRTLLGLTFS